MTIEQILFKDIPTDVHKKGIKFTFPIGSKDIYFKFDKDLIRNELWEVVELIDDIPEGILAIDHLGQFNYIRVSYYPEKIAEEQILKFLKTIKFE